MKIKLSPNATAAEMLAAEELRAADPAKTYTYSAYDVYLPLKHVNYADDKLVDDPAAYLGKAARFQTLEQNKPTFDVSERGLKFYVPDAYMDQPNIATIPPEQLIADGEYHWYKFPNTVIVTDKAARFFMAFTSWCFQLPELTSDLFHIPNTPVDLYLSLKLTGDISCQDPENLPAFYFDRFVVVSPVAKKCESVELEEVTPLELPQFDVGADALDLTRMKVVLPQSATAVEQTAAKELVDYLCKMTGKTLETVTEGAAVDTGIYIGDTAFAKDNLVTYPASEYCEGWAIQAVDGNLVLCGGEARGALYAVYHLLEDVLGVHWWPSDEEFVPSVEKALVPRNYAVSGAPAFKYRDIHPGELHKMENMFMVRNRLNGWCTNARADVGGYESFGSPVYVHSFNYYVPDSMFEEHPDWFSLIDGKRTESSQLCMTNPDLIAYMKSELLRYIDMDIEKAKQKGTARPRWYSLCPNDRDRFCQCEACQAVIKEQGMSGYLLNFVNEIASVVEDKYPDIMVDTLAYWHYMELPKGDIKPAKNVQMRFAENLMDITHSFAHPNNVKALNYLKQWAAVTQKGQLFVWDYALNHGINGVTPSMHKYAEHLRTILEAGATGYFCELQSPIGADFWDMKMWLNAKLLEDPYQDYDVLMNTFLDGYYGAAGPYVRKYLDLVCRLFDKSNIYASFALETLSLKWLTYDAVVAAYTYFDQAFAAAAGDETLLRRLRLARNCLDRHALARFGAYQNDAQEAGKAFILDKKEICQSIMECLKEQIALRGDTDRRAVGSLLPYYQKLFDSLS